MRTQGALECVHIQCIRSYRSACVRFNHWGAHQVRWACDIIWAHDSWLEGNQNPLMASKMKKIRLNCVDRIKCLTYCQSTQWPFQSNGVWTLLQTCYRQLTMPSSAIPMTTWDTHHAHWTQEQEEVAETMRMVQDVCWNLPTRCMSSTSWCAIIFFWCNTDSTACNGNIERI